MIPQVSIGEIASEVSRPVALEPGVPYRSVGVKWYGAGVHVHETREGHLFDADRFQIEHGDLIYNDMWARMGSVAIVPPELAGSVASSHFPTFRLDESKVIPSYLAWYFRTPSFWNDCENASRGSTGRNQIKRSTFYAIHVPLPPLDEQRRIVARIEGLALKVEEAGRLRQQSSDEITALAASGHYHWLGSVEKRQRLGDVCEVIDPNPSHRYPAYVFDDVPMISTSDFIGPDEIDLSRSKHVPQSFFDETLGRFDVRSGDVIFARKGKIGYARAYPAGLRLAMTHTLCVLKPNRKLLGPRYLLHFARSSEFLKYLTGTMNPNLGVPTLGLNVIRDASIPLPLLQEQGRIVAELDALQSKLDSVKALQAETAAELDAMLPAILDKAFKGKL